MTDERPATKRPAPDTLAEFIEICGGPAFVAEVSGRKEFAVRRQGKQGNWPRSRKALEFLSDEFNVDWREEWLNEIEPRREVVQKRSLRAPPPKKVTRRPAASPLPSA